MNSMLCIQNNPGLCIFLWEGQNDHYISSDGLTLVLQNMHALRRGCFHLQKSGWRKPIYGELINLQGTRCWKVYIKDGL